jgi:hypothetical protein
MGSEKSGLLCSRQCKPCHLHYPFCPLPQQPPLPSLPAADPACSVAMVANMISASPLTLTQGAAVVALTQLPPDGSNIRVSVSLDVLSTTTSGVRMEVGQAPHCMLCHPPSALAPWHFECQADSGSPARTSFDMIVRTCKWSPTMLGKVAEDGCGGTLWVFLAGSLALMNHAGSIYAPSASDCFPAPCNMPVCLATCRSCRPCWSCGSRSTPLARF